MAIKADLRGVRVIAGGDNITFSVEHQAASTPDLCAYCGRQNACRALEEACNYGRTTAIRRCDEFMPPLVFRSQKGTEAAFNTFRLGGAWARRLQPGMEVALVDGVGQVFGTARVKSVYFGAIEDMAMMFGRDNHMLRDRVEVVPQDMLKVLRQSYGNLIFKSHDTATVIYLERL